jgi:DNA invertase Pin-like site-specific DNA recombinase
MDIDNIDTIVCSLCEYGDNEDTLLLCDNCNKAMHIACINLQQVPDDDWYCPACVRNGKNVKKIQEKEIKKENVIHPGLRVVFYERVSSKGQDMPEYGRVGLDTQNQELLKFACDNSLIINSTVREVHSARNPDSLAQLSTAISSIGKGKNNTECIIVYSCSRFSRNKEKGQDLIEKIHNLGGWVYSFSEKINSHDPKFIQLLQEAQNESDNLSVKMKASVARIRQQGGHIGPAPFGMKIVRNDQGLRMLQVCPEEQELIVLIRNTFFKNKKITITANDLNGIGKLNRGRKWTVKTISSIVKIKNFDKIKL